MVLLGATNMVVLTTTYSLASKAIMEPALRSALGPPAFSRTRLPSM